MPDEEKHTYQSATLGLPPLKMVLVQAENDRQNEAAKTILEKSEAIEKRRKQKAITKLIEHLNEKP
ncbi:MAG: hypothetical protein HYR70_01580 [Chloroflexi bacterium]|nr:hypothetical protein [Chloroflexota bacterium]MBI1855629.1 hypothetical protein [Chloroflexota bacterium]MBI3341187.1 hypothetical protein [Chloroflexota bacterium]